jgi:uncharacterized membrane protein YczE
MAGFETRGKRDPTGFLVVAVISGIGLIILSIGLGVGISPEVSMLAAPQWSPRAYR